MRQEEEGIKLRPRRFAEIDVRKIALSKYELREGQEVYAQGVDQNDVQGFTQLVDSIKAEGLLIPIIVLRRSEDRYEVIDGGRRLRAARQAKLQTIPAIIQDKLDETEIRRSALIANIHRKDLTQSEKVNALVAYYDSQKFTIEKALDYINIIRNHNLEGLDRNNLFTAVNKLNQTPKDNAFTISAALKDFDNFVNLKDITEMLGLGYPVIWYLLKQKQNFSDSVMQHMDDIELTQERRKILTNTALKGKSTVQKKLATEIVHMPIKTAHTHVKETVKAIEQGQYNTEDSEPNQELVQTYEPRHTGKKPIADRPPSAIYLETLGFVRKLLVNLTAREVETFNTKHIEQSRKFREAMMRALGDKALQSFEDALLPLKVAVDDTINTIDRELKYRQSGGR